MKKALIVSTVSRQFYLFEQANISALRKLGYEVHGAANFDERSDRLAEVDIVEHHIDFQRSPLSLTNIRAYKQLKELVEREKFDLIHCHSPVGGVVGRLVGMQFPDTKVLYTAHGFHFFKGAPLKNWLIFYPIEKLLSRVTDCLITINQEDYQLAKNKFSMKKLELVNGVGVDYQKFSPISQVEKEKRRKQLDLDRFKHILIYVGELSKRKNQSVLINAMKVIVTNYPSTVLLLVGKGELMTFYQQEIKDLDLEDNILLLGFRDDVPNLMQISDIALSSSLQEGLPMHLMEAMGLGLPLIVSDCRGNRDLVEDGENGLIMSTMNSRDWSEAITRLLENAELRKTMSQVSLIKSIQFSQFKIEKSMLNIYNLHELDKRKN
ncbi:glycosyltransferase family 4 protein [Streptococcus sp. E29BA]|uniref:glycosyltransferase family 4 protein n=1 Tax=Streptococcus sp. E29BA TaxID=3278716 RepID=UPI00359D6B81